MQQLVNGIFIGSIYALFALGFTLVFGVLDRLNLAHAAVFTAGGVRRHRARRATPGCRSGRRCRSCSSLGAVLGLVIERAGVPRRSRRPARRPLRRADLLDRRSARCSSPCCSSATAPDTRRFPPGSFPDRRFEVGRCGITLLQVVILGVVPRADGRPGALVTPHPARPRRCGRSRRTPTRPGCSASTSTGHRVTFAISSARSARSPACSSRSTSTPPSSAWAQHRAQGPRGHHRRRHGLDPRRAHRRARRSAWPRSSTIAVHRLVLARRVAFGLLFVILLRAPAGPARRAARGAGGLMLASSSTPHARPHRDRRRLRLLVLRRAGRRPAEPGPDRLRVPRRVHRRQAGPTDDRPASSPPLRGRDRDRHVRRAAGRGPPRACPSCACAASSSPSPRSASPRWCAIMLNNMAWTGGALGMRGAQARHPAASPGRCSAVVAYWFCAAAAARGSAGRSPPSARTSSPRASMGIDVVRHRLVSFVTAGAVAGLYGVLYAHFTRFIAPEQLRLRRRRRRPGHRRGRRLDDVPRPAARQRRSST